MSCEQGQTRLSRGEKLADRYHELMAFRREALLQHRANEFSVLAGPNWRVYFPGISLSGPAKKRMGPLRFRDRPPIWSFVERAIQSYGRATVLEIGPARGELAGQMRAQFGDRIAHYYGIERDKAVCGPYERLTSVEDAPGNVNVVVASEVIEHMTADELYVNLLVPLASKITRDATWIVSTPNPLAPGGIGRDFTHVQRYPWYDLYAIYRLVFEDVKIFRTFYIFDPKRLIQLLPRMALCTLLELEWCDGLVCVARRPIASAVLTP